MWFFVEEGVVRVFEGCMGKKQGFNGKMGGFGGLWVKIGVFMEKWWFF